MSSSEELYQKNLTLIRAASEELATQIDEMPITGVRMMPSASNPDIIIGQVWDVQSQVWVPLCDENDPITQAKNDVDAFYNRDTRIFSVLGHGLGYTTVELVKRLEPHQRLALYEIDPAVWKASMYAVDLEQVMVGKRVDTMIGEGMVEKSTQWWLSLQSQDKLNMMAPIQCGYTKAYRKDDYQALGIQCLEMMRFHGVGISTWKKFGRLIGENDFKNLPEYLVNPGLEALKDIHKGKPAICVSAGPSLKKNLRLLLNPEVRNRVLVISVGTVYTTLVGLGIKPDIVTTIDFQMLNYTDQFANVNLPTDVALVYLHSTYPTTVRRWPGPKFVALNSSDTVSWFINKIGSAKASGAQSQTVAHLNVLTAQMVGANPIILLGQDLSMPLEEHHAPGSNVQDQSPSENRDSHVEAEDIYGNMIYSRHSFLSMRTVFTRLSVDNPGREYINCTEGGINIDGWENKTFAETIEQKIMPQPPVKDYGHLPEIDEAYNSYSTKDFDHNAFLYDMNELLTDLHMLYTSCESIISLHSKRRKAIKNDDKEKADSLSKSILEIGEQINKAGIPISLFALRDVSIIEALARIAPEDREEHENYLIQRLLDISKSVVPAYDDMSSLIRVARKRIEYLFDVVEPEEPFKNYILKLCALRLYPLALDKLKKLYGKDSNQSQFERAELALHVFKQQQRYTECIGIANYLGDDETKKWAEGKLRRHNDRVISHQSHYFMGV